MRDIKALADSRDHFRLAAAFRPKRVIDRCRFDEPGSCGSRQTQQRETVGSARNRNSKTRGRFDQPIEIATKTFDRLRV
jgi:hypothetical protein